MTFFIEEYKTYDEREILPLYENVGWTNYTKRPEMLKNAYEHSLCILAARDGGKLVGILRAVGDGYSVVFIQDILVDPSYQRKGIGTMLLKAALERYASVYQLELMTDDTEKTKAFYRSVGLADAAEFGCCAFVRVNPA